MKAADLSTDQRQKLLATTAAKRDYFAKLVERMQATAWDQTDPPAGQQESGVLECGELLQATQ